MSKRRKFAVEFKCGAVEQASPASAAPRWPGAEDSRHPADPLEA